MRSFLTGLLCGVIGCGLLYALLDKDPQGVTVETLRGDPESAAISYNKKAVTIITDYDGTGSSKITIPVTDIPQAKNWIEKKYSVFGGYTVKKNFVIGATYRHDIFYAGVFATAPQFDVGLIAGYWF